MKSPEELRKHWKTLDYPMAFNPDEPNWTDLTILDIISRTTVRDPLIWSGVPEHILGVPGSYIDDNYLSMTTPTRAAAVTINSSTVAGVSFKIPEIMDGLEGTSLLRSAMKFRDPDDEAYFYKPRQQAFVRLSPAATLISAQWQAYWTMRVDTALNLERIAGITEAQAKTLLPPQSVVNQFRSALDPTVHLINREYLFDVQPSGKTFVRSSILEGGWLFFFQLLSVPRQGRYPFSDSDKIQVSEAIVDVLNQYITYMLKYSNQIRVLYAYARGNKIPLDIFAARET